MESQIEEVKSRVDIVSLISEYVSLSKKGKNYWANCPFHNEKTPSFAVSSERGIFKCFGCGEGGNVFTFYEKIESVSFGQALRALAKRAGVELRETKISETEKKRELLYLVNQKASEFYHYLLLEHKAGKEALEYLKERGVAKNSLKEFKLGFAPNEWESLTQYLLKKSFTVGDLIASGVSLPSEKGRTPYDRFRNRIMFPVFDIGGHVVGFSGRILGSGEPKYLNSSDTGIFNKGFSLYGLYQGKTEIKRADLAILVEGNLDVISSYQAGVKNIVAPLGTSLTDGQLSILKRFTSNIAFCFDQDFAGINATNKSIKMAEERDFSLKIVSLPFGKDPDECIRQSPKSWQEAAANLGEIYDFYLQALFKKYDPNTPDGKRRIVKEFLPLLHNIKDEIVRSIYKDKLCRALGIEVGLVDKVLSKFYNKPTNLSTSSAPLAVSNKNRQLVLEEYLLALVLQSRFYPKGLKETFLQNSNLKELCAYINSTLDKNSKVDLTKLGEIIPQNLQEDFDRLTLIEIAEDILEEEALRQKEVNRVFVELKEIGLRSNMKKVAVEITQAEITGNSQKLGELREKFSEMSHNLSTISSGTKH